MLEVVYKEEERSKQKKNYKKFMSSVSITFLGDGFTMTALPWFATILTTNIFLVSLISTAMRVPWLLLSVPAGVIIDKYSRKKIVYLASFLRLFILGVLTISLLFNVINIWILIFLSFLLGVSRVFFDSATQTMIPQLVEKNNLEKANGQYVTLQLVSSDILGRALGGFLTALWIVIPFALDTLSAVSATILVISLQGNFKPNNGKKLHSANNRKSFKSEMSEGFKYTFSNPTLKPIAIITSIVTFFYSSLLSTQVFFVKEVLNLNAFGFGILITIATVGSIVGGQTIQKYKRLFKRKNAFLFSILALAIFYGLVSFFSDPYIVGVLYFFGAYFIITYNILRTTIMQRIVPDELLGRVGSVFRFLSWGISSIGMGIGGLLVTYLSSLTSRTFALQSPYMIFGVALILLLLPANFALNKRTIEDDSLSF